MALVPPRSFRRTNNYAESISFLIRDRPNGFEPKLELDEEIRPLVGEEIANSLNADYSAVDFDPAATLEHALGGLRVEEFVMAEPNIRIFRMQPAIS